ncbi:MAG: hypothetical protein NT031_00775, partial [Planctomycetota bacterium]|nr:hypothetical protein [Planctomycetota bacterium]
MIGHTLRAFEILGFLAAFVLTAHAARGADEGLKVVPWPRSVAMQGGALNLTAATRVTTASDALMPLAKVRAEEIQAATGLKVVPAAGDAKPGDIELKLDPSLKGESYVLTVGDRALVRGGHYAALAGGTVTLLQAIQ